MPAITKWNRRPCFTQDKGVERRVTWVLPYNKRFNLTQRGRHVACLRKRRAGTLGALLLRRRSPNPRFAG